ncbi:hypothetical protein [Phaffia rhodozyma]|uniref:Uncharacterized protein n=1 Tax=Phaffia rhodozyma TaxID=264483 RepID=A0A0F7SNR5_PHARH|nr:hypothetical protein [Phaffia rhodozyma]
MTDGRYSAIHMSDGALLALDLEEEEDFFGIIPAFDDEIPIPFDLDPPKPDEYETLPSKAHPSYPYGRPYSIPTQHNPPSLLIGRHLNHLPSHPRTAQGHTYRTGWTELGLRDVLPEERGREIPPGMAGAKRGPEADGEFLSDGEEESMVVEEGTEEEEEQDGAEGEQSRTTIEETSEEVRPGESHAYWDTSARSGEDSQMEGVGIESDEEEPTRDYGGGYSE